MTATMEGLGTMGNMLATNAIGDTTYDWLGRKKADVARKRGLKNSKEKMEMDFKSKNNINLDKSRWA